ncbi:MAG: transcription antitermination factor NusB [Nitrospinae bacterium]|nr:transcription antitermination factor NusB [Nitrospinota bacterium]
MKKRRKAREAVLQILYQKDITDDKSPQVPEEFWMENPCLPDITEFAGLLVKGTMENLQKIDSLIENSSENWVLSRMGVIDRNILRMAVYEMISGLGIPVKVVLNEAIEIAKKFGTEDSSKFINGVLDHVRKNLEKNPGLIEKTTA